MSTIRAMCPHCISPVDLDPADVLLTAAPAPEHTGSYAYYCRACERVTVAPVSPTAFDLLVTAGVLVERSRPPGSVHRFTVDDLIEVHQLLNTSDWFAQLRP
jgi:hypothetical protein